MTGTASSGNQPTPTLSRKVLAFYRLMDDCPLLERGYYNLVVNFDVFGSVAHQAQTRLYFYPIRND